jgi:capsular polysaccharide biosynthesis protein
LYDFNKRKDDLENVRKFFLELSNQTGNLAPSKKVFLVREEGLYRKLKNAPEVHQELSNLGFEIVNPNQMHLNEQIELYSQTKVLVAETGAALVNTLFLPENSLVIELKFGQINDHIWPSFIAHKKLDYAQCQMKVNQLSGKANLDLNQLRRIIKILT